MKRKPKHESESHERWLVSYADFITLLFAFFVVLYATSNSDQKKQKEFQESIQKKMHFIGSQVMAGVGVTGGDEEGQGSQSKGAGTDIIDIGIKSSSNKVEAIDIYDFLVKAIQSEPSLKNIKISQQQKDIVIIVPSQVIFNDLSSEFKNNFISVGYQLAKLIKQIDVPIVMSATRGKDPQSFLSINRAYQMGRFFIKAGPISKDLVSYQEHDADVDVDADADAEVEQINIILKVF